MARPTSVPLPAAAGFTERDKGVFAAALERLSLDLPPLYGRDARLEPRAATERLHSHVLRAAVLTTQPAPVAHLYLKVSKTHQAGGSRLRLQERIERDFSTTVRVHETMAGLPGVRTVRPIACYPDLLAIATEEVPGNTLLDRLLEEGRWLPSPAARGRLADACTAAGRWVRAFQRSGASADVPGPSDMREYIDHRLQRIEAATGRRGRTLRTQLLERIDVLAGSAPAPSPAVPVHADLSPSNILVADGHVAVIDFAMARMGHPLQDVARLFAQLDLLGTKPYFRSATIRVLQRALLEGFDPSLTPADPSFRLQVLAQRVNHLASLVTRRYSAVEHVYNWFVCRGHWQWLELEAAGRREARWD